MRLMHVVFEDHISCKTMITFLMNWFIFLTSWLQIAPNVILTDEEIEYRQKQEFGVFCDEETAFLRELGIIKDDDEPLPET